MHLSPQSKFGFAELLAEIAPGAQISLKSEAAVTRLSNREGDVLPPLPVVGLQESPGKDDVETSVAECNTQKMLAAWGRMASSYPGASQASTRSSSPNVSSSATNSSSTSPRQHTGVLTTLQQRCTAATLDDLGTDSDSVPGASPKQEASVLILEDLVSVSSSKSTPLWSSSRSTPRCTPTSFGAFMGTMPGSHLKQAISLVTGDASRRSPAVAQSSHQTIRKSTADACPSSIFCSSPGTTPCQASLNQCPIQSSTMSKPIDLSIMCTRPVQTVGKKSFIDASLRTPIGTVISTSPPPSHSQLTTQPTQDASRRSHPPPMTHSQSNTQTTADASNRNPLSSLMYSPLNTQPTQDAIATRAVPSETHHEADVLTSWLRGVVGPLPSGQELAEKLRAVAPEMYED